MRNLYFFIICSLVILSCRPDENNSNEDTRKLENTFQPHVELLDERLQEIMNPEAKIEVIAEGFEWSEGPLWVEGLGLLFSDIPPNKIYSWNEHAGTNLFLEPSGYTDTTKRGGEVGSNGLLLDQEGRLILCQHGDRRIARLKATFDEPRAEYETIVDQYQGKRFNSPNDACFNSMGDLYFTDPPYGLEKRMEDPLKELKFQGVYKYSVDGNLVLLTDKLSRPNGIAFSPNQRTLFIANSDPEKAIWMIYDLDRDGLIESEQVFFDATKFVGKEAGLPDGLKVDTEGNIFASGPGGIWIFNPDGTVLGKIKTGQATSNCAIGNEGKFLYITADMFVMRVRLKP